MTEGARPQASYAAAYRLLSQLRRVVRELSAGLDSATLARALLATLADVAPYDRAAVYVRSGSERLVPLATAGVDRVDWLVDVGADSALAEAWVTQAPQRRAGRHPARSGPAGPGTALALPLRLGLRTFGLVALETDRKRAYPQQVVRAADAVAVAAALPLETALLFDDVRAVATAEERRRLAREIHDGIAQELASVGYAVDDLAAAAGQGAPDLPGRLRELRVELSRIIKELRLSVLDLRSDVEQHGGLGAALSDYVRRVGATSSLTVHLSLDETPVRLAPEAEAELLRVAQEAIHNARRHAHASNLWVSLAVQPPYARLLVEDDGRGLPTVRRAGSYGLEIMRERAARLGASLEIVGRRPTGTRVVVAIGPIGGSEQEVGDQRRKGKLTGEPVQEPHVDHRPARRRS